MEKKRKKATNVITSVLEAGLLLGAYIFHYFTKKKLGMTRWVNAYNMSWKKKYPLELLKWMTVLFLLAITIFLLIKFVKKKQKKTWKQKGSIAAMLVLSFVYLGFTLFMTLEKMRAYYFVSLMLALAALIQIMKVTVMLIRRE